MDPNQPELPLDHPHNAKAWWRSANQRPRTTPHGDFTATGKWIPNSDSTSVLERRPALKGEQLPLGTHGAFKPSDEALHKVRQENPHLNDYQFFAVPNSKADSHEIIARHKPGGRVTTRMPKDTPNSVKLEKKEPGEMAGYLTYSNVYGNREAAGEEQPQTPLPRGHKEPGEIGMVRVEKGHARKGIATAMYDYAHHVAGHEIFPGEEHTRMDTYPEHSGIRSELGNLWAHYVGGHVPTRHEGQGRLAYGGYTS